MVGDLLHLFHRLVKWIIPVELFLAFFLSFLFLAADLLEALWWHVIFAFAFVLLAGEGRLGWLIFVEDVDIIAVVVVPRLLQLEVADWCGLHGRSCHGCVICLNSLGCNGLVRLWLSSRGFRLLLGLGLLLLGPLLLLLLLLLLQGLKHSLGFGSLCLELGESLFVQASFLCRSLFFQSSYFLL